MTVKIAELGLGAKAEEAFKSEGVETLFPPQEQAVKEGVMGGESLVICTPTASGKTVIAELAALSAIRKGGQVVYVVPLRALASEKYKDFKKWEKLGFRIELQMGDLDAKFLPQKNTADILIATAEKCDSILRSRPNWFRDVKLLVIDEIHLIATDRGPTYEILIAKFKKLFEGIQLLGLSATIGNANELSDWLGAKLLTSDWRPVELKQRVVVGKAPVMVSEARQTIKDGAQSLVFVNSRRSAEAVADLFGEKLGREIDEGSKQELERISEEVLEVLSPPTAQCRRLANAVKGGAAFHHAGIVNKQRELIEDAFKAGHIKVLSATPTLCLEENTKIWSGMDEIPVKSLKPAEKVISLNGTKLIAIRNENVIESPSPDKLIKITTPNYGPIYTTKEHRLLIRRNGIRKILEAKKCKQGDEIATIGKLRLEKTRTNKWSDFVKDNELPFEDGELDELVYYMIGVFLGDGYSGAKITGRGITYKGSPSIVSEDIEIFNRIERVCNRHNINYKIGKNSYGTPEIRLTRKPWFQEFLVRCGIDIGENKHIDKKLMHADLNKIGYLIQGLFDTDGCVEKRGRVSFSNISSSLISDLRKCLLRYGIVTWVRVREGSVMKMHQKPYKTKPYQELYIQNKQAILNFYNSLWFGVHRKQHRIEQIIKGYEISEVSCKNCDYVLHPSLFEGRTNMQRLWGKQKFEVIKVLGTEGELGSRELKVLLGYEPKKKESRTNLHYSLLKRRKCGANEWLWSLNELGIWVYKNMITKDSNVYEYFKDSHVCPLCKSVLKKKIRGDWRANSFEDDIYWDKISDIETIINEGKRVYDVVLPDDGSNDHLFVANGIIVHNSAGVNLPARKVIIRDIKRYTGMGLDYIPILEYMQMVGRAGRPRYDKEGESVLLAPDADEAEFLDENYVKGSPEDIHSQLGIEPVLRTHVLASIASGFTRDRKSLYEFFGSTFFAHEYGTGEEFKQKVERILSQLGSWGFIKGNSGSDFISAAELQSPEDRLLATPLGSRVSELYIDPETAHNFVAAFGSEKVARPSPLGLLEFLCRASELRPLLRVGKKDEDDIWGLYYENEDKLVSRREDSEFLNRFKTALMLRDWADERTEDSILETYGLAPGILRVKLDSAEWLAYSFSELAPFIDMGSGLKKDFSALQIRLKHGIREELMPLVAIKGIGRARARKLFDAGMHNRMDLKKANEEKLGNLVGAKVAKKIKVQL
jgi:helicase